MHRFQLKNIARYSRSPSTPLWVVATVLSLLLIWLSGTTTLNTLSGDDMVFERLFSDLSTLTSIPIEYYMTWTARLSNIFTLNIIFALTSQSFLEKFTLIFSLGVLFISINALLTRLFSLLELSNHRLKAYILSLATTLSICIYSAAVYENFYWMAGVVTYVIPLAGLNFIAAYLLRLSTRSVRIHHFVIIFFASTFIGLFNEVFTVQIVSVCVLSIIVATLLYRHKTRKYLPLAATAVTGFVVSAIIMRIAPGTAYRAELNASLAPDNFDHSLGGLVRMASTTSVNELLAFFENNTYGLLLVSLITILCVANAPRSVNALSSSSKLLAAAVYVLIVPLLTFYLLSLGVHYAYQPSVTNYTLLTANYLAYVGVIAFWVIACHLAFWTKMLNLALTPYVLAFVILVIALPIGAEILQIYDLGKKQQTENNETHTLITSAIQKGETSISIGTSERFFTYCVPEPDPEAWCNKAYRQYYGVDVRSDRFIDHLETITNKRN